MSSCISDLHQMAISYTTPEYANEIAARPGGLRQVSSFRPSDVHHESETLTRQLIGSQVQQHQRRYSRGLLLQQRDRATFA